MPQVAPEHPPPVTVQATPRFAPSLVTVAVNAWGLFSPMVAVVGEMFTLITGAAVTVMAATAVFVLSVLLLTVKVTAVLAPDGAVYVNGVPEAVCAIEILPCGVVPPSVQSQPALAASFRTVQLKVCVALVVTEIVVGATVTLSAGGGGGCTVMLARAEEADWGLVTDIAVSVIGLGGALLGAV